MNGPFQRCVWGGPLRWEGGGTDTPDWPRPLPAVATRHWVAIGGVATCGPAPRRVGRKCRHGSAGGRQSGGDGGGGGAEGTIPTSGCVCGGGGAAEPQNGGRSRGQRLFLILQHHGRAEGCRDSAGGAALSCCDRISTGEPGVRLIPVGSIKSSHTESLRVGKASEIPSPSHRATARLPQCHISIFLAHLQGR